MTKNLETQITWVSLDATSATLVHVHEYFDEATQAELENAIGTRVGSQLSVLLIPPKNFVLPTLG